MITEEDALKVAQVVMTADRGCPYCAANLIERLMAAFPEIEPGRWMDIAVVAGADFQVGSLQPYRGDWRK